LPVMRFKCWPWELAIWMEEKTNEAGQAYTDYSYKLTKSFKSPKSPNGYEHRDIPLFGDDLLKASELLRKAHDFTQVKADTPQRQGGGGRR